MTPEIIIVAIVVGIGFVGFLLIMASLLLVQRNGGWANAMQRTHDGRWPTARRQMLVGARPVQKIDRRFLAQCRVMIWTGV